MLPTYPMHLRGSSHVSNVKQPSPLIKSLHLTLTEEYVVHPNPAYRHNQ